MTYDILEEMGIDIINPQYKQKCFNEKEFIGYSLEDSTDDVDLKEQEEREEEE